MANNVGQTPWILDTAAASGSTGTVWIAKIRWVITTAAAAGDVATLSDGAGNVIWTSTTAATGQFVESDTFPAPAFLKCQGVAGTNGLTVTTLAHGKLYVYLA